MALNNPHKKRDSTLLSLALLAIASTVISIAALTILIDLMWAVAILLILGAGCYRLRAQTPDLNRLAYRWRLSICRLLYGGRRK
jgi:hypothetical protein